MMDAILIDGVACEDHADAGSRDVVGIGPGDWITTRIATPDESRNGGFCPYAVLLVIHHADGSEDLHRGDQTTAAAAQQPENVP